MLVVLNGESMSPTLKNHSILIFDKDTSSIKKNDIVLINNGQENLVKRIVGTQDDYVCMSTAYPLSYTLVKKLPQKALTLSIFKLEKDEYFVQGDNLTYPYDSRNFGTVDKSQIKGKLAL